MKSIGLLLSLLLVPSIVLGHSGGTDSSGCHTDSRTDEYHCHNREDVPRSAVLGVDPSPHASAGFTRQMRSVKRIAFCIDGQLVTYAISEKQIRRWNLADTYCEED